MQKSRATNRASSLIAEILSPSHDDQIRSLSRHEPYPGPMSLKMRYCISLEMMA